MEVKLLTHTMNAAETVAVAGKGCYSAKPSCDIELTPGEVDKTLGVIHPSCYEHAVFTFSISGISRVTSHQLVRHRMASYSQQSQRYVKPKRQPGETYAPLFSWVVPDSIKNSKYAADYDKAMWIIGGVYEDLLKAGVPEEDARYLLPGACTTAITVTMNARELQHFCGLRRCTRAQWEIRELADKMAQAAEEACPELFKHFSLGPQCERLGYCPEHKSCGKMPTISVRIEGVNAKFPRLSEEDVAALIKAIENTPPAIFISGEDRKTEVTRKTRTAEEYREDGYEDLAEKGAKE